MRATAGEPQRTSGFWRRWAWAVLGHPTRREAAWTPVKRSGLMYDPDFIRQSFRPGERVNPLAATVEE